MTKYTLVTSANCMHRCNEHIIYVKYLLSQHTLPFSCRREAFDVSFLPLLFGSHLITFQASSQDIDIHIKQVKLYAESGELLGVFITCTLIFLSEPSQCKCSSTHLTALSHTLCVNSGSIYLSCTPQVVK